VPFFSVIIPTYNRANFLEETLLSVLKQSFQDFEVLIIDDGSTDNTKEIVKEFILRDKRFNYIYQENNEFCNIRNNLAVTFLRVPTVFKSTNHYHYRCCSYYLRLGVDLGTNHLECH